MKNLLLTIIAIFACTAIFAQVDDASLFNDAPPQPSEYGKCYAKCKVPDRYETVSRQVLVTDSKVKTNTSEASFETVSEEVLVQESYTTLKVIPATFTTVEKRILVKEGGCVVTKKPARYATNTTKELVREAYGKWVRKKKAPNCISDNPEDCYVLCWEEIPAEYKYNTTRSLIESESYDTIYSDPVYKTITVKVVDQPARTVEQVVPAKYKTVTKKVLASCGGTSEIITPAKYKTVTEKVLVSAGGYTQWEEVVCDKDINNNLVSKVQSALNDRGYDAGPADGVMGSRTRAALTKFQKENGLPVGNMNIATMRALGVQ